MTDQKEELAPRAADEASLEKNEFEAHATSVVSEERQSFLRKKFDRRVLSIIVVLYVLSYLDRGNIGNAKTAGTQKDLGLSSYQWSWVLYSFYIAYVCFEWTTLFWKIFPAHIYVTGLCIGFGLAAVCSSAVQNLAGICVCRAVLAAFEAMLATGSPFFLSTFYQRGELGIRMALLLGSSPLANCFASALAYGITQINSGMAPWRWLFLIEGLPNFVVAPIVFFFLPDSPGQAKFLSEEDRTYAVERLQTRDTTAKSKVSWPQFFAAFTDYKTWVHTFIHFSFNYSFASLSNFLPTIVKHMGYTSVQAQGLTAPIYLGAFFCCVAGAFLSDRWGKRGPLIAFFSTMGMVGYVILLTIKDNTAARYAGAWFATCGIFPIVALNLTWILNNLGSDSKKGAAVATVATLGQTTSFLGSSVFPDKAAPNYTLGCALGIGFCAFVCFLSLFLHFMLERENKRRDREYGPVYPDEQMDITLLGDDHPKFRYFT